MEVPKHTGVAPDPEVTLASELCVFSPSVPDVGLLSIKFLIFQSDTFSRPEQLLFIVAGRRFHTFSMSVPHCDTPWQAVHVTRKFDLAFGPAVAH